jgi:hypothetical protein
MSSLIFTGSELLMAVTFMAGLLNLCGKSN